MNLVESLFSKQVNYEDSYESVDLTKEELLQLRKDIVLNSIYLEDYENSLGLDPREVHDFFQGFSEFTEELADMQGGDPEDYDTEEALLTYYRDFETGNAFTHYIEESFTDDMEKKCSKCNTPLNDMGTCPVCDDGEEDYEDINREEEDKDKILNEDSLTDPTDTVESLTEYDLRMARPNSYELFDRLDAEDIDYKSAFENLVQFLPDDTVGRWYQEYFGDIYEEDDELDESLTESIGSNLARSAESIADNLDEFLATISDDPDSINGYLGEDELNDLGIASDILHDTAYALSHED